VANHQQPFGFFWGGISPNFDLISTCTKGFFMEKTRPKNSPDFEEFFPKLPDFYEKF
jgi:hypothetical protein